MKRLGISAAAVIIIVVFVCGAASAHRVNLFAVAEEGRINGEGYFAGGRPCMGCPVVVNAPDGRKIAQTKTDAKGRFSLARPAGPGPFKLSLLASGGHKATVMVKAAAATAPAKAPAKAKAAGKTGLVLFAKPSPDAPKASAGAAGVNPKELEAIVARVVSRKLAPVKEQLRQLVRRDGIGVKDIVGGIGWIIGLAGMAAFFQARRRG